MEGVCFNGMDSIDAIGGFVRVESDRDIFYLIEANEESKEDEGDENPSNQ